MSFKTIFSTIFLILLTACTEPQQIAPLQNEQLTSLFERERLWYYAEFPGTGPSTEPRPVPDRMQAVTAIDQQRRYVDNHSFLDQLDAIEKTELTEDDQLNVIAS